jgi:hypothetical protein
LGHRFRCRSRRGWGPNPAPTGLCPLRRPGPSTARSGAARRVHNPRGRRTRRPTRRAKPHLVNASALEEGGRLPLMIVMGCRGSDASQTTARGARAWVHSPLLLAPLRTLVDDSSTCSAPDSLPELPASHQAPGAGMSAQRTHRSDERCCPREVVRAEVPRTRQGQSVILHGRTLRISSGVYPTIRQCFECDTRHAHDVPRVTCIDARARGHPHANVRSDRTTHEGSLQRSADPPPTHLTSAHTERDTTIEDRLASSVREGAERGHESYRSTDVYRIASHRTK